VTRDEIGKIVILASETRFEVAGSVATRFAAAARVPDPRAPGLRIEPAKPPAPGRPAAEHGQPPATGPRRAAARRPGARPHGPPRR
jgi:ATP-dependent RNA helicase DeaD